MKKLILVLLFAFLLFSACSADDPSVDEEEQQRLEEERERLQEIAQDYIEETQSEPVVPDRRSQTSEPSPSQPQSERESEDETGDVGFGEGRSTNGEDETQGREVDISIDDVDVDFSNSFDLDEDEVEFTVDIITEGLEKGDSFIVEIIAFKDDEEHSCQYIYEVGNPDTDEGCELDGFEEYGEHDYEVYADIREKYEEDDKQNNYFRDEFDLEE